MRVITKGKLTEHQMVFSVVIGMMLLSMYLPYQRSLTYIYQIAVVGIVFFLCKASSYAILPIMLLSTTRSYIAVSTQAEFQEYLGLNNSIMLIIMLLLLVLALKKRQFMLPISNGAGYMVLFSALIMMSRLWADNLDEYTSAFAPICLIYITMPMLIETDSDVTISKVAFVLSGFFAALGIVPHLLSVGNIYQFGVIVDRNYQSSFLLICILQAITLMIDQKDRLRWFHILGCWLVIGLDMFIIISSASRSAILALIIAGGVYLILNLKHFKTEISVILVAGIMLLYLNELGTFDFILERFSLANVQTGNGRTELWSAYLQGFMKGNILQKLFGHGLSGQAVFGRVAHNLFVSILYSFGIVGIFLFIVPVFFCIKNAIKTRHSYELISLIPILFMCCTIEPYYRIEFAVYLSVMVGVTSYYNARSVERYEQ